MQVTVDPLEPNINGKESIGKCSKVETNGHLLRQELIRGSKHGLGQGQIL